MKNLSENVYQLTGNQPILLNDSQILWVIQSGEMAIFAVTIEPDQTISDRRYLFTCQADSALFGTSIKNDESQGSREAENPYDSTIIVNNYQNNRQILAVPIGEVELLKFNIESLQDLMINEKTNLISWLNIWLTQWGNILADITPPKIDYLSEGTGRFSLLKNQTFGLLPENNGWLTLNEGSVQLMGYPELKLNSSEFLPLNHLIWLTANEEVQLSITSLDSLNHLEQIISGISQLHVKLLRYIDLLERQETAATITRLQAQEQLNHQVTTEALRELASAFGDPSKPISEQDTSLLTIAGAVGRAMGVTIRPPASSENIQQSKDPLQAIALASRLKIRRVILRDNWWQKDNGPLLAYTLANNDPVALLPISATSYEILAAGTRRRVNAQIAETLAPFGYMFYRSLPDKALSLWEMLQFATEKRGIDLWTIVLTSLAVALLGILNPYANQILFDNAIPDSDQGLLLQVGLGLFVATLAASLLRITQAFAVLRLETVGEASAQTAVWNRLLSLPVFFSRRYTAGDLLSRILSVIAIRQQLGGATLINFTNGLFALLYLGLLVYYSWKLSIIALVTALLIMIVTFCGGWLSMGILKPLLALQGQIIGQNVQLINGISKLRIAGAEKRSFATWSKNYTKQVKLEVKAQKIEDWMILLTKILPTIATGVLFFTFWRLNQNPSNNGVTGLGLSLGTFLAFNSAFSSFLGGVSQFNNSINGTLRVLPQSQRLEPILQTLPEVEAGKTHPGQLTGNLLVDHVTFRYRNDGPLILEDVKISAKSGEFIALVGSSGSGKSTLLRLLLGFETPESGTIYYDHQDFLGLDTEAVRRQLGVVLQNGRLMSGSIFDNIAGGAHISLEDAWEAVRLSGLASDIEAMPMEMHTVISEGGSNLSGGQRQRLLIARALALKPRLLFFDEATSALDNKTQEIVSQSLDNLKVTRLVIAHRLSTIRHADRIYVLQSGRIIQQGSFDELASQKGLFAQLIARQIET